MKTCNCGKSGNGDDWKRIWDVARGLSQVDICPECSKKLDGLIVQIEALIGKGMSDLNFAAWARQMGRGVE